MTLDHAVLLTLSNAIQKLTCLDTLKVKLTPPAPLYLRTLWHYTNALMMIIIIIIIVIFHTFGIVIVIIKGELNVDKK